MHILRLVSLAVATALAAPVTLAQAPAPSAGESVEQIRNSLLSLIRALVDQKVLTVAKAEQMLREAGIDPALLAGPAPGTAPAASAPRSVVRVPYVPEVVKEELRNEIRQEVLAQARAERWGDPGALPAWLSRFSFDGSVRVRWQHDAFAEDNSISALIDAFQQLPEGSTPNTTEDRDRLRVRARLGVTARVSEEVSAGLRLVTSVGGDTGSPVSTNVDQGRFNQRYGVAFDLAYIQWRQPSFTLAGGRILNPYLRSSDLVWAPDLTLDGVVFSYRPRFSLDWSGFATAGVHPLREVAGGPSQLASDKWLYAAQLGAEWRGTGNTSLRAGVGYFDFRDIEGQLNPAVPTDNSLFNTSAPLFRQRGNTMFNILAQSSSTGAQLFGIASQFQLLNAVVDYELGRFDPFRLGISADYVRNLGFDQNEIASRIGAAAADLPFDRTGKTGLERRRTTGYRYELTFGRPVLEQFGHWQLFAGYRYLERDAVPDAFTSADYRLGGTDVKGGFLGINYGLARNTSLTVRYLSTDSIDLAPRLQVDTLFVDLNARF